MWKGKRMFRFECGHGVRNALARGRFAPTGQCIQGSDDSISFLEKKTGTGKQKGKHVRTGWRIW